ncbi:MAG: hypothetical protein QOE70_3174 [Chthoniobacter sp.]|jgi:hypothetical protein|nr:hypothetical protein [Chthoniobacter sp.]
MKHSTLAALVPLVWALISAPSIHAQSSLVAQFHFDEPAGSTTAINSANPVDGTLSPGGSAFVSGGIAGNAISLDRAANGYVTMGSAFQFSDQDFSIVFWVKTTTTANNTFAVARHVAGADDAVSGPSRNGYYVALNTTADGGFLDKATFTASDFDSESPTSTTSVNDGSWHQIVGVYASGVVISTYVDGTPAETSRDPHALVANSSPPFLVGGVFQYHSPTGTPEGRYTGLIDELQIYRQALTDAEIDYLFQHPAEALPATFPEIAVEYPPANNFADNAVLAFGTVAAGTTMDRTLVIRNTGNADLTLGNITFDGADAGSFSVLTPPQGPVKMSSSTALTVRFAPTTAGPMTAALHLVNNDGDENPFDVRLTGTGDHLPEIAVEEPSGTGLADGGARDFGNAASTLTFAIRNMGDANLTLGNLTIDGPAAAAFTVISSPSTPVIPAGATEFTVQFSGSPGFSRATLHLASDDGNENPFEIRLSGGTLLDGPAAIDRLRVKLRQFANEKDSTEATPVVLLPSTLTVSAEDLVYAVFELTNADGFGDVTNAAALARAALEAIPVGGRLKTRADKSTIAPRLLDAAMFGSGLTEASDVVAILTALAKVNDTLPLTQQLTFVGKAALIGRAVQITDDWDPAAGAAIATVARELSASAKGATTNEKLQALIIVALTRTGSAAGQVGSFMQKMLEFVTGDDALKDTFARDVAGALAGKYRVIAGEVMGGRAAQLPGDAAIKALTLSAITDAGLANAIGPIVAATTGHLSGDPAQFAADLIAAFPINQRTISRRGAIASGVLQNVTGAEAGNVIDKALTALVPSTAELFIFANAAAVGTGDVAGDLVVKVLSLVNEPIPGKDLSARTNIGIGAVKAIAVSSPSTGAIIAQKLIDSSPAAFGSDAAKTWLALQLAKAVPNHGPAAGAAVAGVAGKLSSRTVDSLALLARDTVRAAPPAAFDIARELSALLPASDYAAFAQATALSLLSNAPSIAAGVAVNAVADATVTNGQVTGGVTAGDIAAAVALAGPTGALQTKAVVIAGAVARAVDEESAADVGAVVSALLGTGGKLPHLSSIGPLGTSLTQAINAQPLVPTSNRVDEIAELSAELSRQAIARLGPGSTTARRASAIGAIFRSIKNGLGPLLVNGGAFAADRKDATGEIAGAIAQTISIAVLENRLTAQQATDLLAAPTSLADRKSLENILITAAKPYGGKVTAAFAEVRAAALADPLDRIVAGTRTISNANTGGTITTMEGKYEIGSVIDRVTPLPSLP